MDLKTLKVRCLAKCNSIQLRYFFVSSSIEVSLLIYLFHIQVHKIAYMRIPYVVWFVTQPVEYLKNSAHVVSSVGRPYVCHGDLTWVQLCYVQ